MNQSVKKKLDEDVKYKQLLRENSYYYKYLNRDSNYYDQFIKEIKEKYKLRTIDKIDNVIDTIDIISKVISIK